MKDMRHRQAKCQPGYVKELTVQVCAPNGPNLRFYDRLAWALEQLIDAGECGIAPLDCPAPRWSQYVSMLREAGIVVETVLVRCVGPYAGRRGRYVLRSTLKIIHRKEMA